MITCSTQLLRPAYVKAGEVHDRPAPKFRRGNGASTLEELLRIAEQRGYAKPHAWAAHVLAARNLRKAHQ